MAKPQYEYYEQLIPFDESDGISHRFHFPFQIPEEIHHQNDKILQFLADLCNNNLTDAQFKILTLTVKGFTQTEIAKILQINQATVSKHLFGEKRANSNWGGIKKKMNKLLKNNREYQDLLNIKYDMIDSYKIITGQK
jgi:DNA-directed RNA polymerase specialized sigma24 family protein